MVPIIPVYQNDKYKHSLLQVVDVNLDGYIVPYDDENEENDCYVLCVRNGGLDYANEDGEWLSDVVADWVDHVIVGD